MDLFKIFRDNRSLKSNEMPMERGVGMIDEQSQASQTKLDPQGVFNRLIQAVNSHDLEAVVKNFSPDYISEQPFHPERYFTGQAGVRNNWSSFFATIPDIQIDILNEAVINDIVWAELHYHGTQTDGKAYSVKGVTISRIRSGRINWMRLYIEPAP